MLRCLSVCAAGVLLVQADTLWKPLPTCGSTPQCTAWDQLHRVDHLILRVAEPRTLRRTDEAKHWFQIKQTEGHQDLTVVRCRRFFGQGQATTWRCYDGKRGDFAGPIVGRVNFEGCNRKHDPAAFTTGSAYFTPTPIPWWKQHAWWLAAGAAAAFIAFYPGTAQDAAIAVANVLGALVIGVVFALPCVVGAIAVGGFSMVNGDSPSGCDDD